MENTLGKSVSSDSEDLSENPTVNERSDWTIHHETAAYHTSSDASLFSSSLPVLPHEKLNFSESEQRLQSFDDGLNGFIKHHEEDGGKEIQEDVDPSPLGGLLPDENELFAGMMDDFDLSGLPSQIEDLEDDIFDSGGGLEMEPEPRDNLLNSMSNLSLSDGFPGPSVAHYGFTNGVGTVAGEHPYGEHPSRTLFVRNINSNVEDSELKSLFEQYGDIRTLYTACKHRGFVMISYYDIRAARTAMRALQNKPLRRRKLDIHFSIPKENPSEKDINQGTLVVFNLEPSVSNDDLLQIFGAYGEVKEIRETPHKRHHKFIEFYDVRAAEAALKALNRSDIAGKRIKLEPSRPGGARRNYMQHLSQELEQDEARTILHQIGSPIGNSPPGSWPNFGSPIEPNALRSFGQSPVLGPLSPTIGNPLPGLASILPSHISNPTKTAPIGQDPGRVGYPSRMLTNVRSELGAGYQNSRSVPEQNTSLSPGPVSSFDSSGVGTLSGPEFLWGSPPVKSNVSAWPTSSLGYPSASGGRGYPYSHRQGSFLGSHHVGSAPSGNPMNRHIGFLPESPEASFMKPVAFGNSGPSHMNRNYGMNMGAPGNMGAALSGSFNESGSPIPGMMSFPRNGPLFFGNAGTGPTNEILTERGRNRRVENAVQLDNKKQYQLDLEKIANGEDTRTTLMIKNIPNKYTSKMLLAAIDESHKNIYDFLYLPIDFKNKCNVGYAFINMVSPLHIISFHKAFNGKRWEKFNSEKVASLAYARIQGILALVAHFQNSSLMNEDKRCRPILFEFEGERSADQESLRSSNLNICIRRPDGSYSGDSLDCPEDDQDEE